MVGNSEVMQRLQVLNSSFSPSAPIDQRDLFAGRVSQLMTVMNTLNQKGQHAILFGERGVGKTSLARVLSGGLSVDGRPLLIASVNCDSSMGFTEIWRNALREIRLTHLKPGIGFFSEPSTEHIALADTLPEQLTPSDVRNVLGQLGKSLFVFDEFDRLQDINAKTLLADTIKMLSDYAVDSTLLLVGVADSVDALIAEHQSIERALIQVRMPRMSPPELEQVIDKGLGKASMTIATDAKKKIVQLSQGLPHYTHLLSLYSAQRAAMALKNSVAIEDVRAAIDTALANAQQSIVGAYHRATASPRENLYPQVLLACAMAEPDGLGYFAAVDVRKPLSGIMKKPYEIPAFSQHLNAFCEDSRGPVLQRTGTARRYRFRFVNPLMQPYVLMDGIRKGLISS
jgi:Cdc6-like AAA superfamily ATPase